MKEDNQFMYADKQEQLKKANRFYIFTSLLFYSFVVATSIVTSFVSGEAISTGYLIVIGCLSVVFFLVNFVLYKRDKESSNFKYIVGIEVLIICGLLSYGFAEYYMTFLVIYFFMSSVMYYDKKYSVIFLVAFAVVRLVTIILRNAIGGYENGEFVDNMIATFVMLCCMDMIYYLVSRLDKFISDMLGSIGAEQAAQQELVDNVLKIAYDIRTGTENAMDIVNKLNDSTGVVSEAVTNISDSTSSTAKNIQTQTIMTQNIQESIHVTLESSKEMVMAVSELENMNRQSIDTMEELKKQAGVISSTNSDVASSMKTLQERTMDVKSVADTIFAISSQTNLLALNASIESARAGEVGRGFAVVADEIRQLAEKTRQETENIAAILEELNNNAQQAGEAVNQSVIATDKQNSLIEKASECFQNVNENVNKVSGNVSKIDSLLDDLSSANDQIVDNIMQLSATTEEVTASSMQAAEISLDNLKNAEVTKNQLTEVLETSYKLDEYTN